MKRLEVRTHSHTEFVELTKLIHDLIRAEQWSEGRMTLFVPHTTAGITIQENADPQVLRDMEAFLRRLVPPGDPLFRHTSEGADDMPAHVRSALTSTTLSIPVRHGRPALGTWPGMRSALRRCHWPECELLR